MKRIENGWAALDGLDAFEWLSERGAEPACRGCEWFDGEAACRANPPVADPDNYQAVWPLVQYPATDYCGRLTVVVGADTVAEDKKEGLKP